MNTQVLYVDTADAGNRLDVYLDDYFEELSRSYIQKLIKDGLVTSGGAAVKANLRLKGGEEISISLPDPEPLEAQPEDIPLDIVYEDDDLIFINKPKGMVVHPGAGHMTGTVVNALLYHCKGSLSGINGVLRPGIVHRIDKDTSGIIVACKNDLAHRSVAEQLAEHSVNRKYLCIVNGVLDDDEGTIDAPLARSKNNRLKMAITPGGKRAVTHYKVLERFDRYTYIECRLETGRTHQIRVHMDSIHHPLLGDTVYGNIPSKFHTDGQVLHAALLGLTHPSTGQYIEFSAPLPEYFSDILSIIR